MRRTVKPRVVVVAIGCSYEVIAIVTGKLPTLTSMAWSIRKYTWGKFLIWIVGGVLMFHLLMEEEEAVQAAIEEAVIQAVEAVTSND